MDQIAAMRTFIKVVECQSFTKAANQLGISVAMASKLMQQLEESLATRLLSRTTRQVNPTEAGQFYYQRSLALLAELEETHSQLTHHNQQPNGTLKLSVPMDFGYLHLSPALPLFRQRFPDLKLDIEYSDRRVALVEEGSIWRCGSATSATPRWWRASLPPFGSSFAPAPPIWHARADRKNPRISNSTTV